MVKLTECRQRVCVYNRVTTAQVLGKWDLVVFSLHPLPDPFTGPLLEDEKTGLTICCTISWEMMGPQLALSLHWQPWACDSLVFWGLRKISSDRSSTSTGYT